MVFRRTPSTLSAVSKEPASCNLPSSNKEPSRDRLTATTDSQGQGVYANSNQENARDQAAADATMDTKDTRSMGEISFYCGSSLTNRFSVIAAENDQDQDERIQPAKITVPAPLAELLPTPILVEYRYGQQYASATHSAVISLFIPPTPPSSDNPCQPVTCRHLITEIERKANFPGVLGRSANRLRTVHVMWQIPAWVAPTTIIDTLPRSGKQSAQSQYAARYADARYYHYNSLPENYPADKNGNRQWSGGLNGRKGVRRSFDVHGNQVIIADEHEEAFPPFYHGATNSPSKWAERGFHKSPEPTGKWADLTLLDEEELWNTLKLMAVRGWVAHLVVTFEVEIWEPR